MLFHRKSGTKQWLILFISESTQRRCLSLLTMNSSHKHLILVWFLCKWSPLLFLSRLCTLNLLTGICKILVPKSRQVLLNYGVWIPALPIHKFYQWIHTHLLLLYCFLVQIEFWLFLQLQSYNQWYLHIWNFSLYIFI